jgi:nucleoside-diphosphate-sugar epimerase
MTLVQTILVTGGGGFLGTKICEQLLQRGYKVRSFSRGQYAHLDALGVESYSGALEDAAAVEAAVKGVDGIIHSGAKAGVWGQPKDFYDANVVGTKNVVAAARKHGVRRLVYTSSPSVVFSGHSIKMGDESLEIPKTHMACYPETKAFGEKIVLEANDDQLHTTAIRPHFIWGPGDPHILPRLKVMARKNQLVIIGDEEPEIDVTFVDNAAWAHVLALEALKPEAALCGKPYFVGQEEPVRTWDFIHRLLGIYGISTEPKRLSYSLAYGAGFLCEIVFTLLKLYKKDPPLTRFVVFSFAKSHSFKHDAAQRDFGYQPIVSLEEAFKKMEETPA